jgi:pyruvate formate lyase activating enzyme
MLKPAAYHDRLEDGAVLCRLCPAECRLKEGKVGICRSRYNQDGDLVTDNYGELVTLAVDPIEKKPLYHFYPGSSILSTGPNSCNLGCLHCQNWNISQEPTRTSFLSPDKLVEACVRGDSIGVAFTYTEPMMWYEYIMDVAPMLSQASKKVVLVTNGYISSAPLEDFLRVTDAMNVDLKSMNARHYKRVCKGKLQPVLDNIRRIGESKVHLEITNLVIPGENDSEEETTQLIDFVSSISPMIPLHFSAYYPSYKMDNVPTPADSLIRAAEIARESLKYVFLGNVRLPGGSDSLCPGCGRLLVSRSGYHTSVEGARNGVCSSCGAETGIIQ